MPSGNIAEPIGNLFVNGTLKLGGTLNASGGNASIGTNYFNMTSGGVNFPSFFTLKKSGGTEVERWGYADASNTNLGAVANAGYWKLESVNFYWIDGSNNILWLLHSDTGNIDFSKVGATITLKGGSNAASGTVTLVAGTGTITSTAITSSDVVLTGLKAAGGTETFPPNATVSTGTIIFNANPLDTGTYNWSAIHANQ